MTPTSVTKHLFRLGGSAIGMWRDKDYVGRVSAAAYPASRQLLIDCCFDQALQHCPPLQSELVPDSMHAV
jgi:hypothetical protein